MTLPGIMVKVVLSKWRRGSFQLLDGPEFVGYLGVSGLASCLCFPAFWMVHVAEMCSDPSLRIPVELLSLYGLHSSCPPNCWQLAVFLPISKKKKPCSVKLNLSFSNFCNRDRALAFKNEKQKKAPRVLCPVPIQIYTMLVGLWCTATAGLVCHRHK